MNTNDYLEKHLSENSVIKAMLTNLESRKDIVLTFVKSKAGNFEIRNGNLIN